MIFDELGLPRVTGASDKQDSAALAGIMETFKWPQVVNLENYIDWEDKRYVRHPKELIYTFSRDQYVCLISGLKSQQRERFVTQNFVDGKDIMAPSIKGHERRCKGLKAYFWQDAWLWMDVMYHAKFDPLSESNQLLCMMKIAEKCGKPEFLRWWVRNNPAWARGIRKYWYLEDGSWRSEPELAEWVIANVKEICGS